ncbi:MAG: hypothetical protein M3Q07_03225 [Pseudobdellovibrionaceae bacterium]|nr:hypothetical protein [Pseudobdellovibrionaceae bacterium]
MMVVRSGNTEGLTVSQIAEMVNISERAVRHQLNKYAITTVTLLPQSLRTLKDAGVLLAHARSAMFVSKQGIQQLLRHIGTPEAIAIYYQLWNNSEKLLEVEKTLLETAGQLKAALDRSAIDKAKLRLQDEQIAQLEAKLETASHHISLGGNRKAPKFNLPIYVRQPDDIFKKPSYAIELVRKSVGDMSSMEHKRFKLQHSLKVAVGVSGSLIRTMNDLGVDNPVIRDKADILQAAAKDLHSEAMPSEAGLLALNSGCMN